MGKIDHATDLAFEIVDSDLVGRERFGEKLERDVMLKLIVSSQPDYTHATATEKPG